jgi:hypothetical protein
MAQPVNSARIASYCPIAPSKNAIHSFAEFFLTIAKIDIISQGQLYLKIWIKKI